MPRHKQNKYQTHASSAQTCYHQMYAEPSATEPSIWSALFGSKNAPKAPGKKSTASSRSRPSTASDTNRATPTSDGLYCHHDTRGWESDWDKVKSLPQFKMPQLIDNGISYHKIESTMKNKKFWYPCYQNLVQQRKQWEEDHTIKSAKLSKITHHLGIKHENEDDKFTTWLDNWYKEITWLKLHKNNLEKEQKTTARGVGEDSDIEFQKKKEEESVQKLEDVIRKSKEELADKRKRISELDKSIIATKDDLNKRATTVGDDILNITNQLEMMKEAFLQYGQEYGKLFTQYSTDPEDEIKLDDVWKELEKESDRELDQQMNGDVRISASMQYDDGLFPIIPVSQGPPAMPPGWQPPSRIPPNRPKPALGRTLSLPQVPPMSGRQVHTMVEAINSLERSAEQKKQKAQAIRETIIPVYQGPPIPASGRTVQAQPVQYSRYNYDDMDELD